MDLENPEETLVNHPVAQTNFGPSLIYGCNKYTAWTVLEFAIMGFIVLAILTFGLLILLGKPYE